MFSGVAKSGSPTVKLSTSLPFAFNALAFAAAAKVTDGSNRFVLFDNSIPFIPLPIKFP